MEEIESGLRGLFTEPGPNAPLRDEFISAFLMWAERNKVPILATDELEGIIRKYN